MVKKVAAGILALAVGLLSGYFLFTRVLPSALKKTTLRALVSPVSPDHEVLGFLPYWLIGKASRDYSKYITDLAYFGVTVSGDGTVQKRTNPTETEPGWYAIQNGSADPFFAEAKKNGVRLTLVAFSGDEEAISALISEPVSHAQNLVETLEPVMKEFGFGGLNLDIESVSVASDEARSNFTAFVREVKSRMDAKRLGTLTIDVSPTALIKKYLVNVTDIAPYVDTVIFMTYDFHYPGSFVTGPVAPLGGAGIDSEFDTETSMKLALEVLPPHKIMIGTPLYGYEWETLNDTPRAAVIPGTGLAASNRRIEDFLGSCSTCSATLDNNAEEVFLSYLDTSTGTYHQFFYPDENATSKKIALAEKYRLNGLALWALGYEGRSILNPLQQYVASP